MVEKQHEMMQTLPGARPVLFRHVKAVVKSGLLLDKLIAREQEGLAQAAE